MTIDDKCLIPHCHDLKNLDSKLYGTVSQYYDWLLFNFPLQLYCDTEFDNFFINNSLLV